MLDFGRLATQARAVGNVALYPSIDIAIVFMAAVTVFRSGAKTVRRSTSPLIQCCHAMLCVLAGVQCKSWAEIHFPLALAALPLLTLDSSGYYPFQMANLVGIYRSMSDGTSTDVLQQLLCASMHACLILTHLNPQSQKIVGELKLMFLYTKERRLINIQRKRDLTLDDIEQLPERMLLSSVMGEFQYNVNEPLFLLRAIIRMIWRPMIPLYILGSIGSIIDVSTSIMDSRILHFIDSPSEFRWYDGYVHLLLAFVLSIVSYQAERVQSYAYEETKRVVSALKLELFRLPLTNTGLRKGRTLVSAHQNTHRIIWGIESLQSIFATIVGAISSLIPIYGQIGWLVLVPLGMMMAITIIEWLLTKMVGESYLWNSHQYRYKYSGKVDEIFHNIKSIKMFGWERMYVDPELQKHWEKYAYRKPKVWYAPIAKAIWFLFDILSMISRQLSTYMAVYVFTTISSTSGSDISNAEMFQLDMLMNNFQYHIESLTWRMRTFRMLIESNYRIEKVLKGDFVESLSHYSIGDVNKRSIDATTVESTADGAKQAEVNHGPLIRVDECEFAWIKKKPVIKDISFNAKGGELVAVVGKTGSGKSSLLLSICGEVERTKGSGAVFGSIALLEQSPWIMNDTVRENILFGREYDAAHYERVVEACALKDDISAWTNGDKTVIGERGINISGGQKARLALARTVYAKADIYVLDDPLSAVDAHVKRHILDHVIMDSGLLGGKLRVVSINTESLLPYFHQVIRLDDGKASVTKQEPHEYQTVGTKLFTDDEGSDSDDSDAASDVSSTVAADSLPTSPTVEGCDVKDSKTQEVATQTSEGSKTAEAVESKEGEKSKPDKADKSEEESKPKIREWDKWDNLRYVLKICGLPILVAIMFSGLFRPISNFIIDGYKMDSLKENSSSKGADNVAVLKYLRIGMIKQVTARLLGKVETFIETSISDAFLDSKIKSMFVDNLVHVPLSFFDGTSRQEISSAYNKSTDAISSRIPSFLMSSLSVILGATLALYRVGTNAPQLLVVIPLFAWAGSKQSTLFNAAFKSLSKVSREVGIEQNRTDDIIAGGKRLIRLYDVGPHFTKMHMSDSDKSRRTDLPYNLLIDFSWTMYDMMSNFSYMLFRASIIAQKQVLGYDISSGEFITFAGMASTLVGSLRHISRLPASALKFSEKINMFRHYTTVEREIMFAENAVKPPSGWPSAGKIEFRNFSMKYRSDLEYVLKEVNMSINPGEKIGIVGRTGAGKSSLSRVLFRLVDSSTCEGSIVIDGHNIFDMNIGDLRPKLGTIPQESTLFDGTFRQNLDPLLEFTIEDMWAALAKCGIVENVQPKRKRKPLVSNKDKDANADEDDEDDYMQDTKDEIKEWDGEWADSSWKMRIFLLAFIPKPKLPVSKHIVPRRQGLNRFAGGGSNFSSGQEQLFSLCRLLMRKRNIIVLDEATADVDLETDQDMQKLFRSEFKDSTVLTIAHRLETIMGSDRIIVMDKGRVAEFGPPDDLIAQGGLFAELVKANDFEH